MPIREQGVDGKEMVTYRFTPDTLDFGGFKFAPTMITAAAAEGIEKNGVDGLLGFDLMASHLAIIDLGADILWMK